MESESRFAAEEDSEMFSVAADEYRVAHSGETAAALLHEVQGRKGLGNHGIAEKHGRYLMWRSWSKRGTLGMSLIRLRNKNGERFVANATDRALALDRYRTQKHSPF